ncbi:MAG TPA: DUF1552 domain-containing protein [Tepidisphaeraceae bacterium]|jgi:hypothetical protein|nr:DUF1552 domain-containing protein [Tepidisphaeraceae bacterium]
MSNILSQNWLLNRRHFLRGVGAAVALPLLNCMKPIHALASEIADRPRRSVFVYIPNGVNVLTWQIAKAGRDYQLSEPMMPLEKHRANMTPISGLHHPGGIGQAHVCADTWLTAAKISQEGGAYHNTVSADQLMAEVTSVKTRFSSLELSISAGVGQPNNASTLAWSRDGVPLPAEDNPRTVFNRLFGVEQGGVDVQRRRLNRRHSVLDVVLDDAKSLRKNLGNDDRNKLDEYLHSVRDVEVRTERLDAWLTIPKPKIDPQTTDHLTRNVSRTQAGEYYRTMYDLIVLTLRTDMTRVVSYMSGSEGNGLAIPEIGIPQTRHELSHHNGDPEQMARLSRSDGFITQQFSYFLDQLQSTQDGDESLLDRTMVLFGSGMSYGHSHGNANLPTILAGGRALGLKHGQHIDYNLPVIGNYDLTTPGKHYSICHTPTNGKARLTNLLLTMMQKMGVNNETFVDSLGTISEVA